MITALGKLLHIEYVEREGASSNNDIILLLACFSMGLVITTAYDSMPADSVNHIIKETEAKAIFTEVILIQITIMMQSYSTAYTIDFFVWNFKQGLC